MIDSNTPGPLDVLRCPLSGIHLIEASAGTGKTWNICGLYLRLVLERGLPVRQILVVTFTTAATAELRDRIRQRLVETRAYLQSSGATVGIDPFVPDLLSVLRARPEDTLTDDVLTARIDMALAAFDEAAIFTIHSFCQRALADAAFAAQMPLRTEVIQSDDDLRREVVNDFWRRRVAADQLPPELLALLIAKGDSPATWSELLKQHLSKPKALRRWPASLANAVQRNITELTLAWHDARTQWHTRRAEIIECLSRASGSLHGGQYKDSTIKKAATEWDALLRHADPTAAIGITLDKASLLGVTKIQKALKSKQVAPEHSFFQTAQECLDLLTDLVRSLAHERLGLVADMLAECQAALQALKRQRHVVAYDDMLGNLYERLTSEQSPWLAETLRERFPAAFIDEFQDTDPLQFEIFQRIHGQGPGPLFLVGDPKQSIYGFRNADLATYLEARHHADALHTLTQNQRSTPAMLRALNALFGRNPALFMNPALQYRAVQAGSKPRQHYSDPDGAPAALQIWTLPDTNSQSEPLTVGEARWQAALATADEIVRLLNPSAPNRPVLGERPVQAGDIAILVRTHTEGSLMRQALADRQVGSVMRSRQSVFASVQAEDLERVLAAVLEPTRDRLVRAALATESMGLSAGDIERLNTHEAEYARHCQAFAELRQHWLGRGVGFMLRKWLSEHQVAERQLAQVDGERRLTNLLHLFECLHQASQEHPSPDALLKWLRSQRGNDRPDDEVLLRLESDENLVQIVTVHASKGLEYPIVFCPFFWSASAKSNTGKSLAVQYHDDHGRLVIDYRLQSNEPVDIDEIRARQQQSSAEEFFRLVYVAFTRAVHRCIVVAGSNNKGKKGAGKLLNWLVVSSEWSPRQWLSADIDMSGIPQAWRDLVEHAPNDLSVSPLPQPTSRLPLAAPASRSAPCALEPPSAISMAWRIGSYSSLAHGAQHEQAAADHDVRVSPNPWQSTQPGPETPVDDILRFPRGAAAGECLHAVLEQIDFTDPTGWPRAIESALRKLPHEADQGALPENGRDRRAVSDAPQRVAHRMIERMLVDITGTDLPVGTQHPLRLQQLPLARRLTELEFHLPSANLDASRLNDILARYGFDGQRLTFPTLTGYLKGFIDLVFEHDGRYFVLDWKSNHLGLNATAYNRQALSDEMTRQGYHLQYLLYSLAVQRYLKRRLPDFDSTRHFGGVVYLFVRGVRPHWQLPDGTPAGLYFTRPDPVLMEELDHLFSLSQAHHD